MKEIRKNISKKRSAVVVKAPAGNQYYIKNGDIESFCISFGLSKECMIERGWVFEPV